MSRLGIMSFSSSQRLFLGLLAISITALQYLADQLSYLRFDTILHIAAAALIDANDARHAFARRMGGLANPI